MRARLFFAFVTALGCATAAGAQTPPQVRAEVARLPDGRGVAVHCLGDSGPVVLLNSGLGMDAGVWTKVQGGLAARYRACAFDRPGYGRSDEAGAPRDADHMPDELRAAATAAGLPGPYILVGHSLGGDAVRRWASQHPAEIAGLVLVDPNIDGADGPLKAASPAFVRVMALMDEAAGKCIRATAEGRMTPGDPLYAACGSPPVDSPFARPAMARTVLAEQALQAVSSQQVQAAEQRGYGKLPLIVLTAGGQFAPGSGPAPGQAWPEAERTALRRAWLEGHEAIAARSSAGLHRVINGAPHAIHLARPEAVIQAIEEVAAARAIDAAMREAVGTGWTAGGAVAVMRGGQAIFSQGYGLANLETGTPATSESVFRIGSLTKQFTAAAILLLVEDGKLSLDDRVGEHLAQFPAGDPTTIRQLLTHTSGLADYLQRPGFDTREKWLPLTTDELLAYVLAAAPLHRFPPGEQWQYSNSNYVVAGALVEKASGETLGAFLRTRIFAPLKMTDTALDDGRDIVPNRAEGYDRLRADSPGYIRARTISMTIPFGAGALRSTVGDLLTWSHALTHGGVVKPDSFRELTTPARLNDGSLASIVLPDGTRRTIRYGMGIAVLETAGGAKLTHDGAVDGFTAMLAIYPEADVAVVALVNTSPSEHLPFRKVINAVEAGLIGAGPR